MNHQSKRNEIANNRLKVFAITLSLLLAAFTKKTGTYYKFTGSSDLDLRNPFFWAVGYGINCGSDGTVCYVLSSAAQLTEFRELIDQAAPSCIQDIENIDNVSVEQQKSCNN